MLHSLSVRFSVMVGVYLDVSWVRLDRASGERQVDYCVVIAVLGYDFQVCWFLSDVSPVGLITYVVFYAVHFFKVMVAAAYFSLGPRLSDGDVGAVHIASFV